MKFQGLPCRALQIRKRLRSRWGRFSAQPNALLSRDSSRSVRRGSRQQRRARRRTKLFGGNPCFSVLTLNGEFEGGAGGEAGNGGGARVGDGDFVEAGGAGDDAELAGRAIGVGAGEEFGLSEAYGEGEGTVAEGGKFNGAEIGDEVAEAIDVEDGADVGAAGEARGYDSGAAHGIVDELAKFGGLDAGGEVGGDGGEDVAAVEGGGEVGEPESGLVEVAGFGFVCGEEEGEETVVGTDEGVALSFDEKGAAVGADAGVDDGDVDGALGEVGPGLLEEEGGLGDAVGWDFVGNVGDLCRGGNGGDDAFHGANEMVGGAEVGKQGDHRYSVE